MFNVRRGKQSGEKGGKTRKGKSWEGRKDSEWQRTQEMLFGGKVRREKTNQDLLLEMFGSQQIKFLFAVCVE